MMFFQGCSDAFGKELTVQSSQNLVRIRNFIIEYVFGFDLLSLKIKEMFLRIEKSVTAGSINCKGKNYFQIIDSNNKSRK